MNLDEALVAWRRERTTELADLIDRLTERAALPQPPQTRSAIQRWWMANAVDPDPRMIGRLIATFGWRQSVCDESLASLQARWPDNPVIRGVATLTPVRYLAEWAASRGQTYELPVPNWVARAAAMIAWPDDPRITHVLGNLLADFTTDIHAEPGDGPWPAIVERLRGLRDRRLGPLLATRITNPSTTTYRQRAAHALCSELAGAPIAPAPRRDLPALWREVAEHPDDDGPRLVLADALLAAGDNRGELITLQCAPDPAHRNRADVQAGRLIRREWARWMGDLVHVLARRGTKLRRGMLDAVRIGLTQTPPWAWRAVEGHRELAGVREVRPAQLRPEQFADFVRALPRFPRVLEIEAHEVLEQLVTTHRDQAVERIHYAPTSSNVVYWRTRPPGEAVIDLLARLAPDLAYLDLGSQWWVEGEFVPRPQIQLRRYGALLTRIAAVFPRLIAIRIERSTIVEAMRGEVAGHTKVELVDRL